MTCVYDLPYSISTLYSSSYLTNTGGGCERVAYDISVDTQSSPTSRTTVSSHLFMCSLHTSTLTQLKKFEPSCLTLTPIGT